MKLRIDRNTIVIIAATAFLSVSAAGIGAWSIHYSSSSEFCMWCHEMRVVGEQGWMHSVHFNNPRGVVAECHDCHIPPEVVHMMWVKARDGGKDVAVHLFGVSAPHEMDWAELGESARRKISDSSCMKCHKNMMPMGASIKQIVAHRAYFRLDGQKKCLDCHREEFHGDFREYIDGYGTLSETAISTGGDR